MPLATTTDLSQVPVVILAGGRGTRLRPLTFAVPKALLWAGREPILGGTLGRLRRQGFRRVYLALGYQADLILAYVGNSDRWGLDIHATRERRPLGTAGPLRVVVDSYDLMGPVLVVNADLLTRARLDRLVSHHVRGRAALTVAVLRYLYRLPLGEVKQRNGRVIEIREKPVLSFEVSAGMYVVESDAARLIPRGRASDMPSLIARAISRGLRVLAYPLKERWLAVDEMQHLQMAQNFWGVRPK
jgi:NDP-sugar pyrophosphorylase family protein